MRYLSRLVLAAGLLAAAGCSTMNQIHAQPEGPAAMGGVRYTMIRWSQTEKVTPGEQVAMFLDLPLSFALDVVLLPFSGINEIVEGGIDVTHADLAVQRPDDPSLRRR